jgi:hypothetical protein
VNILCVNSEMTIFFRFIVIIVKILKMIKQKQEEKKEKTFFMDEFIP